jgi:hypothetical protein
MNWQDEQVSTYYSLAHLAVPYGGRQDARLEPKYKHIKLSCMSLVIATWGQWLYGFNLILMHVPSVFGDVEFAKGLMAHRRQMGHD